MYELIMYFDVLFTKSSQGGVTDVLNLNKISLNTHTCLFLYSILNRVSQLIMATRLVTQ